MQQVMKKTSLKKVFLIRVHDDFEEPIADVAPLEEEEHADGHEQEIPRVQFEEFEDLCRIAIPGPPPKDIHMQQVSDNVLVYISGYITSKIRTKVCQSCQCIVSGQLDSSIDHLLLTHKQYAHCKEKGLQVPSRQLVEAVKQLDVVYVANIEEIIYKQGVKACLSVLLMRAR